MTNLAIEMILLMATGFILGKANCIDAVIRKGLINICLYVILPCNILASFEMDFERGMLPTFGNVLIAASFMQLLQCIIAWVAWRKAPDGKKQPLVYGTMISNQGFLGLPVVGALLGNLGLIYASVALIPLRIAMWTVAMVQFAPVDGKKALIKLLLHPCMIAIYLGLLLAIFAPQIPKPLDETIRALSRCILPLVMITMGSQFSDVNWHRFLSSDMVKFVVLRLGIIPGIVFLGVKYCVPDPILAALLVIYAGMPPATTTSILAEAYDKDALFASKIVLLSTLLSLITVPLWMAILKGVM